MTLKLTKLKFMISINCNEMHNYPEWTLQIQTLEGVQQREGDRHPLHVGDEIRKSEHPRQPQDAQQGKGA